MQIIGLIDDAKHDLIFLLININKAKLNEYKNEQKRNETVNSLQNDINNMKDEIGELKSMLKEISERL